MDAERAAKQVFCVCLNEDAPRDDERDSTHRCIHPSHAHSISIVQKWTNEWMKNHSQLWHGMSCHWDVVIFFSLCRCVVSGYHSISAAVRYIKYTHPDQIGAIFFLTHSAWIVAQRSRKDSIEIWNGICVWREKGKIQIDSALNTTSHSCSSNSDTKNMFIWMDVKKDICLGLFCVFACNFDWKWKEIMCAWECETRNEKKKRKLCDAIQTCSCSTYYPHAKIQIYNFPSK